MSGIYNEDIYAYEQEEDSRKVWHSYIFNSGVGNREGLDFSNFELSSFSSEKNVSKWEATEDASIVGLGKNFLILISSNGENSSSSFKADFNAELRDVATFRKWDPIAQKMVNFVIIAGCNADSKCFLKWYHISDEKLVFFWDWALNKNVSHIHVMSHEDEMKLLVVGDSQTTKYESSVDVYGFAVDGGLYLWLLDRFLLEYNPSQTGLCNCNDEIYLVLACSQKDVIYIYRRTGLLSGLGPNHFELHHKIVTRQFFSMNIFHVGLHCYVAVASLNSSIYKLRGGAEVTSVAKVNFGYRSDWLAVPINKFREEILLFAKGEDDAELILWSEKRGYQSRGNLSTLICGADDTCKEEVKQFSGRGAASLRFKEVRQNIVFTSINGDSKVLRFHVSTRAIVDAVERELKEMLDYRTLLENEFNAQELEMKMFEDIVLHISDEFDSHVCWKLKNVKCNLTTVTPKPNGTVNAFEFALNEEWAEDDYTLYRETLAKIDPELFMSDTMNEIDVIFNGFEVIHAVENAPLPTVIDAIAFLGNVEVTRLNLSYINGVDVNDMLHNSFMFGSNRKIGGFKTVTDIHVDNISFEKLGDISACDILFANELQESDNNVINGDVVYESDVVIHGEFQLLPADGHVTDFNLYPSRHGFSYDGRWAEQITFDHLFITEDSIIEESVNGRPLMVPIRVSFDTHLSLDKVNQARVERVNVENILTVGFINDRNFTNVIDQLKKRPSIDADKQSAGNDVLATGSIDIEYLNGIKFPEGFVRVDDDSPPAITAYKKFTNHLIASHARWDNKDVYSESNESNSDVANIFVSGNAEFDGIIYTNSINNYGMDKFSDVLQRSEESVEITGKKYFKRFEVSKKLKVKEKINFLSGENGFMKTSSEQRLNYSQSFEDVEFERLRVHGTWDGIDVSNLNRSIVRLSKNGVYESSLIFANELMPEIGRLVVSRFANDSPSTEKCLILHKDAKLRKISAANVTVNGSFASHQINKHNIAEFNSKRMSRSGAQVIRKNFNFANLNVRANLNLRSNASRKIPASPSSRGEEDVDSILEYVINKTDFPPTCVVVKGDVRTAKGVNGIDLYDTAKKVVSISRPAAFHRKIVFNDSVTLSGLKINGRLQKIHLKRLYQDLIYATSHVSLKGSKNFVNNLTVTGNMKVRSLNGHQIQRIMTKKGDYSIKESVIINGDVLIVGNVTAYSTFNNCSTTDLFRKYSAKFDSYVVMNDIFLDTVAVDHLVVGGSVGNRSFDSFMEDVVYVDEKMDIEAKKVFDGVVRFEGNVVVEESFNGLNLSRFFEDIVFIDREVTFEGDLIMRKAIIKNADIGNSFNATLINGFRTSDWLEESIMLDEDVGIDGKKKIKDPYCHKNVATDFVNGHLAVSMIPLNTKQFIPNFSYFRKMNSISDISVGRWVNDKNLNEEFEETVMIDRNEEIKGFVVFPEEMSVNSNVALERANGRDMKNVASLYTEQLISSVITFQDKLVANREIEKLGYINEIDIKNWNEKSITLDKSQVITSSWAIRGNVTVRKGVEGTGLLGDGSIINVEKSVAVAKIRASEIENKNEGNFRKHCETIMKFSNKVSLQPNVFYQLEISQALKAPSAVESLITFRSRENQYLILTFFDECLSMLYVWNNESNEFKFLNRINIGPVEKWIALHKENATFLVTTASNDSVCEDNSKRGNIWKFDGSRDKYGHVTATEGFADFAKMNESSDKYYAIGYKGEVCEWTLEPEVTKKFILQLEGGYRFVDFNVFEELALTNGTEIRNVRNEVLHTFAKPLNGRIAVTGIRGRKLIAVPYHDQIVVYENLLKNKIFTSITASKVGSVEWFSAGSGRKMLLYESQQNFINLVEFKGTPSPSKKIFVPISIHNVMLFSLHQEEDRVERQFFFFWHGKKVLLLEASFLGMLYKKGKRNVCL